MVNRLKKLTLLALAGLTTIGLNACTSAPTPDPATLIVPVAPKTADQKLSLYNYLLNERGIDIVKIGETMTIVISSDALFETHSANVNEQYVKNLDVVARLINSYDTTSVAINAYTTEKGDVAQALTEKQAQEVLYFLKKHGIDTRLIFARGNGNLFPISIEGPNHHLNRRIEIKFKFHPEPRIYQS